MQPVFEWVLHWWPLVAGLIAAIIAAYKLIMSFRDRLAAAEARHTAHEGLCTLRYNAIESQYRVLTDISDERHSENRDRFKAVQESITRVEQILISGK